jgi:hypothetical protein
VSGHFIFAEGKFCREVDYEPEYYFHGEEINLSVRSYMAGYDLFAPHKVFIWHEYIRDGKKKHWDDHSDWVILDKNSHRHNRELLGIDKLSSGSSIDNVGINIVDDSSDKEIHNDVRSLFEYEKYAGLEFSTRRVHTLTLDKKIPPVSLDDISHKNGLVNYHRMCIDVYKEAFGENDYDVWAVAFVDATGKEIFRQDADADEITRMLSVPFEQDKFVHVWRNFYSETRPVSWVVWPHSKSRDWETRLTGYFPGEDYNDKA